MGHDADHALGALRLTLGRWTSQSDVDQAADHMRKWRVQVAKEVPMDDRDIDKVTGSEEFAKRLTVS